MSVQRCVAGDRNYLPHQNNHLYRDCADAGSSYPTDHKTPPLNVLGGSTLLGRQTKDYLAMRHFLKDMFSQEDAELLRSSLV